MKNKKWFLLSISIVITALLCAGSAGADESKLAQNITCKEAHEMIQKNPKIVLIDVRTQPEFQFVGYIEGSYNIPYWFLSSQFTVKGKEFEFTPGVKKEAPMNRYQFTQNPDFMKYVKQIAKPADEVIVYCGSSKRSALAADDLIKAGYENVYNMLKGFSNGWVTDKLPSKEMLKVKTIDPKYIYPPDRAH
ncbi:MAG: rhodanese-like domain-containing protein [bacterium]